MARSVAEAPGQDLGLWLFQHSMEEESALEAAHNNKTALLRHKIVLALLVVSDDRPP